MSISAQNVSYLTSAPVPSGSGILAFGGSSLLEFSYIGTATFVLDGAATTATLNFEDGTNALPWIPSAVLIQRIGGNTAATVTCYASAPSNTSCTVNLSAAGSANNTYQIAVFILK